MQLQKESGNFFFAFLKWALKPPIKKLDIISRKKYGSHCGHYLQTTAGQRLLNEWMYLFAFISYINFWWKRKKQKQKMQLHFGKLFVGFHSLQWRTFTSSHHTSNSKIRNYSRMAVTAATISKLFARLHSVNELMNKCTFFPSHRTSIFV